MSKILRFLYIMLGIGLVIFLSGCHGTSDPGDYLHSVMIPKIITFKGQAYENTGEVVAIEKIPDNVNYIGDAYLDASIETETTSESEDIAYEVYSIEDTNMDEAIAVKFLHADEKERAYYYYRYSRQQN